MKNLIFITSMLPCLAFSQVNTYVSINPVYIRNVEATDQFYFAGRPFRFYLAALSITEEAFRTKFRLVNCYLQTREFDSTNAWLLKCAQRHPKDCCELVLDEASDLNKSLLGIILVASTNKLQRERTNTALPFFVYRLNRTAGRYKESRAVNCILLFFSHSNYFETQGVSCLYC